MARQADRYKQANWQAQKNWYELAPVGSVLVREYKDDEKRKMSQDVARASSCGWQVEEVSRQSGHINVGRSLLKGPLLVTGASRSKGITILRFARTRRAIESSEGPAGPTGVRASAEGKEDILTQIEKLAELHKSGVLSDEEFAAKKAELLSRL